MKSRVWPVLLLAFCCWHAVFLVASIAPRQRVEKERGNPALNLYRLFAGGNQQWNVFDTIPTLHSLDVRIEVDDGAGGRRTLGSVLPGFTPYPKPELLRYNGLFYRMPGSTALPSLFEAYLRKVDGLLSARPGSEGAGRWALVIDAEWIRTLSHSRRDGVLYVFATRSFDPANPGGIPR